MKRNNLTFTTPKSKALIKAICKRLRESAATVADLAGAVGKSVHTVKAYLAHLLEKRRVVRATEAYIRPQGGSAPAVWALNVVDAPRSRAALKEDGDSFERKVVVRQQWEPCHRRMALDCYLFGLPAAWQGAAA